MSKITQKPVNINEIMIEAFHKLDIAHDFFDDEMSPFAQKMRATIIAKCRAILKEHGDLG